MKKQINKFIEIYKKNESLNRKILNTKLELK